MPWPCRARYLMATDSTNAVFVAQYYVIGAPIHLITRVLLSNYIVYYSQNP